MKQLFPVLAILLLSGCDDARKADGNAVSAANATEGASAKAATVSGFKSPELAGLAVRDHPQGVQVVTPPKARGSTPPMPGMNDRLWITYAPNAVLNAVNGTPVRNAVQFRELMDAAAATGKDIEISQVLFLHDEGNGMVSIHTDPPKQE